MFIANKIDAAAAQPLIAALPAAAALTALLLASNALGEAGGVAIAEVLRDTTLTELSLRSNQLKDAGAAAIADALSCHPTLGEIVMSNNGLTAEAEAALDKARRVCAH